jgi:hypothetical protein
VRGLTLPLVDTQLDEGAIMKKLVTEQNAHDYLAHFGIYKPAKEPREGTARATSAAGATTPDNDPLLRAAVVDFQLRSRLSATGRLDLATLAQMNRPRCGFVPPNGSGSNGPVASFVAVGSLWKKAIVTFRWDSYSNKIAQDRQRQIVADAMRRWSDVVPIVFRETNGDADIVIRFAQGDHGDGYPFDGAGHVLAHAFFPPPSGGSFAGDVHFDEDERWQDGVGNPGFDLLTVSVHELGHALGLDHSNVPNSTMNPYYPTPATPQPDDRDGIRTIYREHVWVASLYRDVLGRRFDDDGLNHWVAHRHNGAAPSDIALGFLCSWERSQQIATSLYSTMLDRDPDPDGLAAWTQALSSGLSRQAAMNGFLTSPEYTGRYQANETFVESLYVRLLARNSDPGGFAHWVAALNGGTSRSEVVNGFLNSDEYTTRYAAALYHQYLRRAPEPEGLEHWKHELQSGRSHQSVSAGFVASQEYRANVLRW